MTSKCVAAGAVFSVLLSAPRVLQGATLSKTDSSFMKMAAQTDMMQAHLGQMAETQAHEQRVKDFGKKLSTDHTNSYEGLTVLANKTGETIPKKLKSDKTLVRLTHLKGKSFDHAFIQAQVQSQKTAVAAFKNEAAHGENPDVKEWANRMVPTLEGNLQTAESLAKGK